MKYDSNLSKEISRNLLFALKKEIQLLLFFFLSSIAPLISHWQSSQTELQTAVLKQRNVSETAKEHVVLELGS